MVSGDYKIIKLHENSKFHFPFCSKSIFLNFHSSKILNRLSSFCIPYRHVFPPLQWKNKRQQKLISSTTYSREYFFDSNAIPPTWRNFISSFPGHVKWNLHTIFHFVHNSAHLSFYVWCVHSETLNVHVWICTGVLWVKIANQKCFFEEKIEEGYDGEGWVKNSTNLSLKLNFKFYLTNYCYKFSFINNK